MKDKEQKLTGSYYTPPNALKFMWDYLDAKKNTREYSNQVSVMADFWNISLFTTPMTSYLTLLK